jgi:acyl-CoA thioesterase-1
MNAIRLGLRSYGNSYGLVQRRVARIAARLAGVIAAGLLITLSVSPASAQDKPIKIVAFGDSLTAGYGLPGNAAFPTRLNEALRQRGHVVAMTNAGVSGDTTTAGLARVDWSVPDGTEAVIVELGANDFLRGTDPAVTLKALDAILAKLKARNMQILLCGFIAGKNMGADYERAFNAIFPTLAKKYDAVFFPWFLDQVGGERRLNQGDGIHPNAEGVDVIVKNILPYAEQLIARAKSARGS